MLLDISGKTVVVTGAGRGIGEVVARRMAGEKARLALWEKDPQTLKKVADELTKSGADVLAIQCDVSVQKEVDSATAKTLERFSRIDVLVNNAGVAPSGPIESMDPAQWEETYATNVRGVYLCSRAVIPAMKKQKWGRIMNASSFAAIIPSYAFAAYASSKAAVASFTRVLAAELGPWNITANAYAPGMVPTQMNKFAEAPPDRQKMLLDTLALRRWSTGDDIASLLIFLASEQAGYISGALIDTSGGKFAVQFPQIAYANAGL